MITTTADHFEVFGDGTTAFLDLVADVEAALAEPARHTRDMNLTPSAIPPSDRPAVELPNVEPSEADLLAIELEFWGDEQIDDRIAATNTLAAYQDRRLDLLQLRACLPADALIDDLNDEDLERVA